MWDQGYLAMGPTMDQMTIHILTAFISSYTGSRAGFTAGHCTEWVQFTVADMSLLLYPLLYTV